MRSAKCTVITTICIERPKKSTLIPTKCIALINNERADINIECADINIEPALGRSQDADGRSDGALVNIEGNNGRSHDKNANPYKENCKMKLF